MAEFVDSFESLSSVGPAVTVFGSARTKPRDPEYKATVSLAKQLAKNDLAVITGGGPGIMEAANKGAAQGKGKSVGLNIELPFEQSGNRYANLPINFHYFFSRKVCLVKYSMAFVQTRRIPHFPLILFGSDYWTGLVKWMKSTLKKGGYIGPDDLKLFKIVDTPEEAVELVLAYRRRVGVPQEVPPSFQ